MNNIIVLHNLKTTEVGGFFLEIQYSNQNQHPCSRDHSYSQTVCM